MPRRFKARSGDTLCTLAIREGGFTDCSQVRADAANAALKDVQVKAGEWVTVPDKEVKAEDGAVKQKHKFKSAKGTPPYVRFVHGSEKKDFKDDFSLQCLQVSNVRTDKGGLDTTAAFPSGFGFADDAHVDEDTFKIEVRDADEAGDTIKVQLEALKRQVAVDGTVSFVPFAAGDPDAAKRKVEIECKRVAADKKLFRSRYLRLVTDVDDFAAAAGQTLLVADIADGTGGAADAVEILDQQVRASYALPKCAKKGDAKAACVVTAQLPVGRGWAQRRVRLAVHVLRKTRDGAGVVTLPVTQKACLCYIRRLYAQAELGFKLVAPLMRLVQPPANLIAVDDREGRKATGGATIKLRIRVNPDGDGNDTTKEVTYTTRAKDTPATTAERLANRITLDFGKTVRVRHSSNPPITGKARGSADVIVGDPLTQLVTVTILTNGDATQPVAVGRVLAGRVKEFGGDDSHVGTLEERTLVKNYDSGTNRVDLFVVEGFNPAPGSCGEAFTPNKHAKAEGRPRGPMMNSVLVFQTAPADPPSFHTTIPHEIGHVLMDHSHVESAYGVAANAQHEMMGAGSPVGATETVVGGPKRIADPRNKALNVTFSTAPPGNPCTFIRTRNAGLRDAW
jgi:hypothetical protein